MKFDTAVSAFFLDYIGRYGNRIALSSAEHQLTYQQLDEAARKLVQQIPARSFVFCICKNTEETVVGYVGFMQKRIVPVMISGKLDPEMFHSLLKNYDPQYIWCPKGYVSGRATAEYGNYCLIARDCTKPPMEDSLALLLSTSGSTGSAKLVRQTYRNIQANTASIVDYLQITPEDRAITTLPMSYTYGLSIIQSHLMAGARLILTEKTFFDKEFWVLFREQQATTFGGVPYHYQMLDRLRFLRMDLPSLRYVTQAGGKLGRELHNKFASQLQQKNKAFIVMYGATEATARMSYVPSDASVEKAGSIGIAIPGGRFELLDEDGQVISEPDHTGELVYYGDNVTPGYAQGRQDLALGDTRNGRLETGDMAVRDADGFYYVAGRKKRFLKIFGNRVNLMEIESLLSQAGCEAACTGEDDHMRIYTTAQNTDEILQYISQKTALNPAAFSIISIEKIPRNEAGKVLYSELK